MLGYGGDLKDFLKVGLIQTIVDDAITWLPDSQSINMSEIAEEGVWQEIKKGFRALNNSNERPNIIILPELTLPHGYLRDLATLSKTTGTVVIAGLDFEEVPNKMVRNRAVVIVPQNWPESSWSTSVKTYYYGKTFFSQSEKDLFGKYTPQLHPFPDPTMYIMEAGPFGIIGVAICSDFFDIERFVIYKGRIHHMIVISHNQDIHSYYFLAEAISRLVYCNVVICNTGLHGGTLVFSPYRDSYKRIIYRHEGADLFSSQVLRLPVFQLDKAQEEDDVEKIFKAIPPGYTKIRD